MGYLLNMVPETPEAAVSAALGSACCTENPVEQRDVYRAMCACIQAPEHFTLMSPWLRLHLTLTDMHLE